MSGTFALIGLVVIVALMMLVVIAPVGVVPVLVMVSTELVRVPPTTAAASVRLAGEALSVVVGASGVPPSVGPSSKSTLTVDEPLRRRGRFTGTSTPALNVALTLSLNHVGDDDEVTALHAVG